MRHPTGPILALTLPCCLVLGCQENALKHIEPDSAIGQPELAVSPEVIDFGVAGEGEVRAETFTLSSFGEVPVNIGQVSVSGATAFSLTWPGPVSLDPGEELDVVVSWSPASYDDEAHVLIESDALTPQLEVGVFGEGLYPGIEVDPASMSFQSDYGESDEQELTVRSVGTTDLVVSQTMLIGASFGIDLGSADGVFTLAPGMEATFPVTYTPPGEDDVSTGDVWFTSNAPDPNVAVPLYGQTALPCYGLGEAWDRGVLDVSSSFTYQLVLTNSDPDVPICMDQWYVFLSDTSQDAIAGDPYFDLSGEYPYGSITIAPSDYETFAYGARSDYAWYCIEHEQYTTRAATYDFHGARAPEPLLDFALSGDQDGLWARQDVDPAIAVGRTVNYLELGSGQSGAGGIVVYNIGEQGAATTVTETLPPGFDATAFSLEPDGTGVDSNGGKTYTWTLVLDGRHVNSGHGNTVYDQEAVTWTLNRTGGCSARVTAPEAVAVWQDSDGTEVSTANPLIIGCPS